MWLDETGLSVSDSCTAWWTMVTYGSKVLVNFVSHTCHSKCNDTVVSGYVQKKWVQAFCIDENQGKLIQVSLWKEGQSNVHNNLRIKQQKPANVSGTLSNKSFRILLPRAKKFLSKSYKWSKSYHHLTCFRVMLKIMKPKCDKMVMKHEKWTPTLMPQLHFWAHLCIHGIVSKVSEPPIQKKCSVQCKTCQSRVNVPDILILSGFIIFSMTRKLSGSARTLHIQKHEFFLYSYEG